MPDICYLVTICLIRVIYLAKIEGKLSLKRPFIKNSDNALIFYENSNRTRTGNILFTMSDTNYSFPRISSIFAIHSFTFASLPLSVGA